MTLVYDVGLLVVVVVGCHFPNQKVRVRVQLMGHYGVCILEGYGSYVLAQDRHPADCVYFSCFLLLKM